MILRQNDPPEYGGNISVIKILIDLFNIAYIFIKYLSPILFPIYMVALIYRLNVDGINLFILLSIFSSFMGIVLTFAPNNNIFNILEAGDMLLSLVIIENFFNLILYQFTVTLTLWHRLLIFVGG